MSRIGQGRESLFAQLPEVSSSAQAIQVAEEYVRKAELARLALDDAVLVEHQRRAYDIWAILYGKAQGALEVLVRVRYLDDVAHDRLGQRLLATAERRTVRPPVRG